MNLEDQKIALKRKRSQVVQEYTVGLQNRRGTGFNSQFTNSPRQYMFLKDNFTKGKTLASSISEISKYKKTDSNFYYYGK